MQRMQWLEGLFLSPSQRRELARLRREGAEPREAWGALLSVAGNSRSRATRVQRLLAQCSDRQIQLLTPADESYPRRWMDFMVDFPPVLFVRGRAELLLRDDAVAIVGARKASAEGIVWAERCGAELARSGHVVVSGLAYGVDAAAHRGCLAQGGEAVAVLGTAVDCAYPPEHAGLQLSVQSSGCLVSELPPGFGPRQWNFVARNRLIAALGRGVVVVEAGLKSGTRSTVEYAQDYGRDVLVVPPMPNSRRHEGVLELARQGAGLVRDAHDVMDDLRLHSRPNTRAATLPGGLVGPARVEEIAAAAGRSVSQIVAELSRLEIEGKVRRLPGGLYVATERRRTQSR